MTTSTLEVADLFSVLGAHGLERQLRSLAGVGRVSVSPVSGLTTVTYDSARIRLSAIQAAVEACGFHCAGEALPKHACDQQAMSTARRRTRAGGPAAAHVRTHGAHTQRSPTKPNTSSAPKALAAKASQADAAAPHSGDGKAAPATAVEAKASRASSHDHAGHGALSDDAPPTTSEAPADVKGVPANDAQGGHDAHGSKSDAMAEEMRHG